MEKLQYDSFYKFLVSLGIVFIALPIFALVFVINSEILLLTQAEYESLSQFSLEAIQQRQQLYDLLSKWIPLISKILIPIGIILIILGGRKWLSIQRQLDEQVKSDTIMKKINAENMSTSQIVVEAAKEVSNAEEHDDETIVTEPIPQNHHNKIIKYMQIEEMCYSNAVRQYSKKYDLKKNVRVGEYNYDFIAISKKGNTDILFEVKYWHQTPPTHITSSLFHSVFSAAKNYESISHRNHKSIVLIVVPKEKIERMKINMAKRVVSMEYGFIEVMYIAEEDLMQNKVNFNE